MTNRHSFLRHKAIEILGAICQMCETADRSILDIDHRNGGGNKHREEIGGHIESWIVENPDAARKILRLLCANCHRRYGARVRGGRIERGVADKIFEAQQQLERLRRREVDRAGGEEAWRKAAEKRINERAAQAPHGMCYLNLEHCPICMGRRRLEDSKRQSQIGTPLLWRPINEELNRIGEGGLRWEFCDEWLQKLSLIDDAPEEIRLELYGRLIDAANSTPLKGDAMWAVSGQAQRWLWLAELRRVLALRVSRSGVAP